METCEIWDGLLQDKKEHKNFRKLRKQRKNLFNEIVD